MSESTVRAPGGLSAPLGSDGPQFILDHQQSQKWFCSSSSEITEDRPSPLSGPSAGIFSAEMYLGKTAITLSFDVQIRWSWTRWKAYLEDYTTQLNIWSKTQWIKAVFHSKGQPNFRRKPKTFLASQSWSTSTPTLSPLQMCQHHHVNNTMCMCVSISQSFSKDFNLISLRHSILATSQC